MDGIYSISSSATKASNMDSNYPDAAEMDVKNWL